MAKSIRTSIVINSSKETVWHHLTNLKAYSAWNPFIIEASGELTPKGKLDIQMKNMKFQPTILEYEPVSKFSWLGHLLVPGVFDGLHSFELIKVSENECKLMHQEQFKGLLVYFMGKKFFSEIESEFNSMNIALKARCESNSSESPVG